MSGDPIQLFRAAITATLGNAPEHIEPGRLHRFPTTANRASKPGYCKLWPDYMGGFYGDFRAGVFETWAARERAQMSPAERLRLDKQVAQAKAERDREQAARWQANRSRVRAIWQAAGDLTGDDPVSRYLASRGLSGLWPLPAVLRHHPALPYWHDGEVIGTFPAMVARFHAADGRCVAIHQTYLTHDGQKADVPTVKKMSPASGLLVGGCIPLAQPVGGALGIAEGIETALCAGAGSGLPVVAAYSAGCLAGFTWPKGLKRLVIFGDNDVSGTGQAAAARLAGRARDAGVSVSVTIPQTPGADWADVWAQRDQARIDAVADSLERAQVEGGAYGDHP